MRINLLVLKHEVCKNISSLGMDMNKISDGEFKESMYQITQFLKKRDGGLFERYIQKNRKDQYLVNSLLFFNSSIQVKLFVKGKLSESFSGADVADFDWLF